MALKTLNKSVVKRALVSQIEINGQATNRELLDTLRTDGYHATIGMIQGFTNQIYTENKRQYSRGFENEVIYKYGTPSPGRRG